MPDKADTDTVTVRVTRRIRASPEDVFDAWLDPGTARHWLFATPTGSIAQVEVDARVGGGFKVVDQRGGEDITHTGKYLTLDRPSRLVFEFEVPRYSDQATRIAIDIAPVAGGAELTLLHAGVLPAHEQRTRQGWANMLASLDDAVRSG